MAKGLDAKSALKWAFKEVVRRAAPLCRVSTPCARILTYHNVGRSHHEMNVEPDAFRIQMQWLQANRTVVPLRDALATQRGVAITFDDGYRDNLVNAAPVLKELGLPAAVFMIAGRAGAAIRAEPDLDAAWLMTWGELREIESLGFEIGSHTMTHPRLASLTPAAQRKEILESKDTIEHALGHSIGAFAYPYGSQLDFTLDTAQLVREAGYRHAASNQYGVVTSTSDIWAYRRIWIDRTDTLESFKAKVSGDLDGLRVLDTALGIRGRRILNRLTRTG